MRTSFLTLIQMWLGECHQQGAQLQCCWEITPCPTDSYIGHLVPSFKKIFSLQLKRKEFLSPNPLNKLQVVYTTWSWAVAQFSVLDRNPGFSFWATE